MPSPSATANQLAILLAARLPSWQQQTDGATASEYDRPPTEASGTAIPGASASLVEGDGRGKLKARVAIKMRREAFRRRVDLVVTADAATTYQLTANATAITATTGIATVDGILVDIKAQIDADLTVGGGAGASQKISGTLLDADGNETVGSGGGGNPAVSLAILGVANDNNLLGDFYFDFSTAAGAGTATLTADVESATYHLWRAPLAAPSAAGTISPGGWQRWGDSKGTGSVTIRGFDDNFDCAGCSRMYVELTGIAANASDGSGSGSVVINYRIGGIWIGPAILETEQT